MVVCPAFWFSFYRIRQTAVELFTEEHSSVRMMAEHWGIMQTKTNV